MDTMLTVQNIFEQNLRAAFLAMAKTLPCRTIIVNDKPYLRRYYLGPMPCGSQKWLHEFLSSDPEPHLHSHPWTAVSRVITGGYTEELYMPDYTDGVGHLQNVTFLTPQKNGIKNNTFDKSYTAGDENILYPDKIHRIKSVEPGTLTLLIVAPERTPYWEFYNPDGTRERVKTSPVDWHKTATTLSGKPAQLPEETP